MAQARRKFDEDFKQGAVRLVRETGKPIAQVARELGGQRGNAGQLVRPRPAAARRGCVERGRARGATSAAQGECRAADAV
jgi:transposase-like protein